MVLAAPEFVIAERIELLDEIEVAAELQHGMLAERAMRGEESSEFEARHLFLSGRLLLLLVCGAGYVLNGSKAIAGIAPHAACCHARSRGIARCDLLNRINLILPDGQITSCFPKWPVQPLLQKYFCFRLTQIRCISLDVPSRPEGRIARRHERGAGCGGRGSVRRCQGMAGRVDKARERTNGTLTNDARTTLVCFTYHLHAR